MADACSQATEYIDLMNKAAGFYSSANRAMRLASLGFGAAAPDEWKTRKNLTHIYILIRIVAITAGSLYSGR